MSTLSERMRAIWKRQMPEWTEEEARDMTYFPEWADEVETLEVRYYELLYAVASKHEGETRHETALRYIVERENSALEGSVAQVENRTDILKKSYEKLGLSSALRGMGRFA